MRDQVVKRGPTTRIPYDIEGDGFSGTSQMYAVTRCSTDAAVRIQTLRVSEEQEFSTFNATFTSFAGFKISSDYEEDVAFMVELSEPTPVIHGQRLVLDRVLSNEGGRYFPDPGTNTCSLPVRDAQAH